MMDYKDFMKDIEKLEVIIKESQEKIAEIKEDSWFLNVDTFCIDEFIVSCNYESWLHVKENKSKYPFLIKDVDYGGVFEVSLEGAKRLVEYLQEKIDFLES